MCYINILCRRSSGVEQLTRNEQAAGSNPIVGFNFNKLQLRPIGNRQHVDNITNLRRGLLWPKIKNL